MNVAGERVRTLRHGMAGATRTGAMGPVRELREVREAILEAGREFGLEPCGSRAYGSNTLESGWIPSPLPAIYTGEELRSYREWLPADELRGHQRAGRQLRLGRHRGLLPQPFELGYGPS